MQLGALTIRQAEDRGGQDATPGKKTVSPNRTAGAATRYRLPTLTKNAAVCAHNDSL